MSPATKFDDHPAVSLILVKPASNDPTPGLMNLTPATGAGDQTSRAAMMQLIYELMLLIGENMSKIQQANATLQLDQAKLAEEQAKATQADTAAFIKKLNKLEKEEADAKKWGLFSEIMKWVGVAVAVLVGALLIESGAGLAILALAIAITTIPVSGGKTLFDMGTGALAEEIAKIPGIGKTWANVIAQVFFIVVLTVASCGVEGVSAGIGKAAATAGQEAADVGVQATVKAAEEAIEESVEEVAEEASAQVSKANEDAPKSSDAAKGKSQTATTQMFLQTFFSSSILQDLQGQVMRISIFKKNPWLATVLTVALELGVMIAAYKLTPASGGGTLLKQIETAANNVTKVRAAIASFVATTQLTTQGALAGQSYNTMDQGETNKEIAPIEARLLFEEGFMQIMTQLVNIAQKTYQNSMNANEAIFKTDFSSDMRACVAAQQQYQG